MRAVAVRGRHRQRVRQAVDAELVEPRRRARPAPGDGPRHAGRPRRRHLRRAVTRLERHHARGYHYKSWKGEEAELLLTYSLGWNSLYFLQISESMCGISTFTWALLPIEM